MKRTRSKSMLALVAGATLFAASPTVSYGQAIAEIVQKADAAGAAGDWATAYPLYKEGTELFPEERSKELYGDSMGYLWFRRGQGALALGQKAKRAGDKAAAEKASVFLEDAIKAFQKAASIGTTNEVNKNRNKSNYHLGQSYMEATQYASALKAWELFQAQYDERNPGEQYVLGGDGRGKYILEQAICMLRQKEPDLERGKKGLAWVMDPANKARYRIPDSVIVGGFKAYCEAIKTKVVKAKGERKATMKLEQDIIEFMNTNRGVITLAPYQMYAFAPFFLNLSMQFQNIEIEKDKTVGLNKAAFALMSFIPNTTVSKEDMEAKINDMGVYPKVADNLDILDAEIVKGDLTKLNGEVKKGEPHEMTQNLIMASYYEEEGNSRAAYGIYEMIELYHSDHPKREEWLFHLVRTSYNIGEIFKTVEYGERYLAKFPQGTHRGEVEKFMLTSLFRNKRYAECVKIAEKILPSLTAGTKPHDIALYCLGGSYYYQGLPDKAQEPLTQHVTLYGKGGKHPESEHIVSTTYWNASNDTYLLLWQSAGKKLDAFLKAYPDPAGNPFFALAKYDRANCYTNTEEYQKSIDELKVVISDHQSSPVIAQAYSLRGNNYQSLAVFDLAVKDYKKALGLAKDTNNESVEAEVLNFLVALLGDDNQASKSPEDKVQKADNFKAAVAYYDEFWAKYSKGPYKAFVAVAGMPPLQANKRGEEGLQNLKEVITLLAKEKDPFGMEKAVNTYTDMYLLVHNNNAKKLEEHYRNDFKFSSEQIYARSLVKMSMVSAYEILADQAKRNNDDAGEQKWKRAIQVQLDELAAFDLSKLNNYTLVSIGDNIRRTAKTSTQLSTAVLFYEQVMKNAKPPKRDAAFKNEAMFGLANVLMKTRDKDKLNAAYVDLQALKDGKGTDRQTKEKAHKAMVEIAYGLGKFQQAIDQGSSFTEEYKTSKFRVQVRVILAEANEQIGNAADAMRHSKSILGSMSGNLEYSGPAILRLMRLYKSRYDAYVAGSSYVRARSVSFDAAVKNGSMPNDQKDLWAKIKSEVIALEKDPAVIAGRAAAAEQEKARIRVQGK